MAFKMKSAFKQGFLLTPRISLGNVTGGPDESHHRTLTQEEMDLMKAKAACKKNPNTRWKNGACVKIISENTIKIKSNPKSKPSVSSGNFA